MTDSLGDMVDRFVTLSDDELTAETKTELGELAAEVYATARMIIDNYFDAVQPIITQTLAGLQVTMRYLNSMARDAGFADFDEMRSSDDELADE